MQSLADHLVQRTKIPQCNGRFTLRSLRNNVATRMHWVRKNRRFGSSAALCALIIQLVLSFGHMHPDRDFWATLQPQRHSSRHRTPAVRRRPTIITTATAMIFVQFARRSTLPRARYCRPFRCSRPRLIGRTSGSPTIVPRKFHLSCVFISRHARLLTPSDHD